MSAKKIRNVRHHKNLTLRVMPILLRKFGPMCWYCGLDLTGRTRIVEHIIAVSKGGTDDWDNLALACLFCNSAKYCRDIQDLYDWLDHVRSDKFKRIYKLDHPHPQSNIHLAEG